MDKEGHKKQLEELREQTDEIRFGIGMTEEKGYKYTGMMDIKGDNYDIEASHIFQEKLSQSEEFQSILEDIRKVTKIAALRDAATGTHGAPWYSSDILRDTGTDYDSVNTRTLRVVSDEFYRRHKDNMADFLGAENLESLQRLKQNNQYIESIKLDELVTHRGNYMTFVYGTHFGSGGGIGFSDELCQGHLPKEGDKILLATNFIEDPEYGKLEKRDAFVYENGKHKHFYQAYLPLREYSNDEVVNITKAMQQKTQTGATKEGPER